MSSGALGIASTVDAVPRVLLAVFSSWALRVVVALDTFMKCLAANAGVTILVLFALMASPTAVAACPIRAVVVVGTRLLADVEVVAETLLQTQRPIPVTFGATSNASNSAVAELCPALLQQTVIVLPLAI